MCRLLALAGSGFNTREWLDALKRVAERDPLRRNSSHGDGWGLAAFLSAGGGSIVHYKSSQPIWEDSGRVPLASLVNEPALLIAHARKASIGMPRGVGAAHPFALYTSEGSLLFVAQNGEVSVEKVPAVPDSVKELARKGGLVDSLVYALALAKLLEEGLDLLGALSELHESLARENGVEKMANTAVLLVGRTGNQWSAQLGVVRHLADGSEEQYGELYVHRGGVFTAVASSSLAFAMEGLSWEPVRRNAAGMLDLEKLEARWRRF